MVPIQCTVCNGLELQRLVSFGQQPLSTQFSELPESKKAAARSSLSFGYCKACGTMQLVDRFPLRMLQNKHPKIQFREPKEHLSKVVESLKKQGVIGSRSATLGLSYIDADLLEMLPSLRTATKEIVDKPGLSVAIGNGGLESMQAVLSDSKNIEKVLQQTGKVDFLSARFILEHAQSASKFLISIAKLVRSGGCILIEVPDASKIIKYQNYALIWEDHFSYFTEETIVELVEYCGLDVVEIQRYTYAYEDVLTLILRVPSRKPLLGHCFPPMADQNIARLSEFGRGFDLCKVIINQRLDSLLNSGKRVAIFGAGHHAAKFVNFFCLETKLDFVVDDNSQKAGMFMPGTDLQIRTSIELQESMVSVCLSTLNPSSEEKVRIALLSYFEAGGIFLSAFSVGE